MKQTSTAAKIGGAMLMGALLSTAAPYGQAADSEYVRFLPSKAEYFRHAGLNEACNDGPLKMSSNLQAYKQLTLAYLRKKQKAGGGRLQLPHTSDRGGRGAEIAVANAQGYKDSDKANVYRDKLAASMPKDLLAATDAEAAAWKPQPATPWDGQQENQGIKKVRSHEAADLTH